MSYYVNNLGIYLCGSISRQHSKKFPPETPSVVPDGELSLPAGLTIGPHISRLGRLHRGAVGRAHTYSCFLSQLMES